MWESFREELETICKDKLPGEIKFYEDGNPIAIPKCKAEIFTVTAVLNYENPTCLSASVLVDKNDPSKFEGRVKSLVEELLELHES